MRLDALYEVFEPQRVRAYVKKLQFCYTPKHGSWLNIAENELSSLTRQYLKGRRFGDLATLCEAVGDWFQDINSTQKGVDWQLKIDGARAKRKAV